MQAFAFQLPCLPQLYLLLMHLCQLLLPFLMPPLCRLLCRLVHLRHLLQELLLHLLRMLLHRCPRQAARRLRMTTMAYERRRRSGMVR